MVALRESLSMTKPTFSIEVITLPVSDVERALRFYVDQLGFTLDVDYSPSNAFRVVQLTPPGSGCSIQIGNGLTAAPAGSLRNICLVVTDLDGARNRLLANGVEVGEIRHKTPVGSWDGGFAPGLDPARRLCQLRQLLRPGRQYLGAPGAWVPHRVMHCET
jgi:catechol 2,3-dioxygenase-like lactoylglutathione lyase family enzyme